MTRRCQWCVRLFTGDVCPGCGAEYAAIDPVPDPPADREKRGGGVEPGTSRRETCADCGAPLPQLRAPTQRCKPCAAERTAEMCRQRKRDRRAAGLER